MEKGRYQKTFSNKFGGTSIILLLLIFGCTNIYKKHVEILAYIAIL